MKIQNAKKAKVAAIMQVNEARDLSPMEVEANRKDLA